MEKKVPSKFKVRIVAQGDMTHDIIAEVTEFFDRREVQVGYKEVYVPNSSKSLNIVDRCIRKIFGATKSTSVKYYDEVYETQVTRGYDIWFHFGGKPQNFKFDKSEVENLIENGEWIILD